MTLAAEAHIIREETLLKPAGILTVIAGPTAVGKNAVLHEILSQQSSLKKVVSMTTRKQREREVQGFDYHYKTREEFLLSQEKGELLEWVEYGGEFYGVAKDEITPVLSGQDRIWIVNMGRAAEIRDCYDNVFDENQSEILKRHTVVILIGAPNIFGLRNRYKERGDNRDSFGRRMRQDWEVWQDHSDGFDHVVLNRKSGLDSTVEQISDLIEEKRQSIRTLETILV